MSTEAMITVQVFTINGSPYFHLNIMSIRISLLFLSISECLEYILVSL